MKKFISFVACIVILITHTSNISAQTVPSPYKDDSQIIMPMKKGHVAPFSGVLFSPGAAASVSTEIDSFKEKLRIEREAAVKMTVAQKDFEINDLKIQQESEKKILNAIIDTEREKNKNTVSQLQNANSNWIYWVAGGTLGGALITFFSVYATQKLL